MTNRIFEIKSKLEETRVDLKSNKIVTNERFDLIVESIILKKRLPRMEKGFLHKKFF